MVTMSSASLHTVALVVLVLTSACDPAARTTAGGAEPATAGTNDSVLARRIARECVIQCDKKHERGSGAHLRCARHCMAERQDEAAQHVYEEGSHSKAPWAIVFAVTVSSALAVLAMLF